MATELYAVAGSKIYIGGVLSTKSTNFVAGDFASQSWVEIDGWETAGAIGDTAETISTALINRGRVIKQKGTRDAGSMECNFASIAANAGQLALRAAVDASDNYAFRIVWSTGEVNYFIGLPMSKSRPGGGANDVMMLSATIEINSNVVEA